MDGGDNLYVASFDGNITKINPAGRKSTFTRELNTPEGLAFDAAGNLYAACLDGTVKKITTAGAVSTFASGFNNPVGLAFDSDGNLYVANYLTGVINKITTAGSKSTFATVGGNPSFIAVSPVPKPAPGPLTISVNGTDAAMSWTGAFVLESSTNLAGLYSEVTGAVSPLIITNIVSASSTFFRLHN